MNPLVYKGLISTRIEDEEFGNKENDLLQHMDSSASSIKDINILTVWKWYEMHFVIVCMHPFCFMNDSFLIR